MDKLFLFRTLIFSLMICLLARDGLRILIHSANDLPGQHKQVLLMAALLWISSALINQRSNDDDWAGQI